MALAVLGAAPASAQIVVTSAADVAANDGQCTLREALVAANTDAASGTQPGECAAGSGADAVTVALAPGAVVLLTASLPRVTQALTPAGPTGRAEGLVADGGGQFRLFELVSNNLQQMFTLRALTLRHARTHRPERFVQDIHAFVAQVDACRAPPATPSA